MDIDLEVLGFEAAVLCKWSLNQLIQTNRFLNMRFDYSTKSLRPTSRDHGKESHLFKTNLGVGSANRTLVSILLLL